MVSPSVGGEVRSKLLLNQIVFPPAMLFPLKLDEILVWVPQLVLIVCCDTGSAETDGTMATGAIMTAANNIPNIF